MKDILKLLFEWFKEDSEDFKQSIITVVLLFAGFYFFTILSLILS